MNFYLFNLLAINCFPIWMNWFLIDPPSLELVPDWPPSYKLSTSLSPKLRAIYLYDSLLWIVTLMTPLALKYILIYSRAINYYLINLLVINHWPDWPLNYELPDWPPSYELSIWLTSLLSTIYLIDHLAMNCYLFDLFAMRYTLIYLLAMNGFVDTSH